MKRQNSARAAASDTGALRPSEGSQRNTTTDRPGGRVWRRGEYKRAEVPDFAAINDAALCVLAALLSRWLPGGRREGREYISRNPRRHDKRPGSFKVNLASGRWADFASGDKGGDPVALAAYLFALSQSEAARRLAAMLGVG